MACGSWQIGDLRLNVPETCRLVVHCTTHASAALGKPAVADESQNEGRRRHHNSLLVQIDGSV